jgi:transposase
MSVTEQRYKAVLAVIGDGRTVGEVAGAWGISRRTMHRWLARYEGDGLEGLNNRSHRPAHCPHQTSPAVEATVLEMRRAHSYWGARRIAFELARKRVVLVPSESAVYRCLVRAAVIDPMTRRRRRETWKRWERGGPMELWQLDLVHGFLLADGSSAKALTGIDDHSRYCVSARLIVRPHAFDPLPATRDGKIVENCQQNHGHSSSPAVAQPERIVCVRWRRHAPVTTPLSVAKRRC